MTLAFCLLFMTVEYGWRPYWHPWVLDLPLIFLLWIAGRISVRRAIGFGALLITARTLGSAASVVDLALPVAAAILICGLSRRILRWSEPAVRVLVPCSALFASTLLFGDGLEAWSSTWSGPLVQLGLILFGAIAVEATLEPSTRRLRSTDS